jgi:hypothetical protein
MHVLYMYFSNWPYRLVSCQAEKCRWIPFHGMFQACTCACLQAKRRHRSLVVVVSSLYGSGSQKNHSDSRIATISRLFHPSLIIMRTFFTFV